MKVLLDTNILIWVAFGSDRLSNKARDILVQPQTERFFSVASLWEIAIKGSLGRSDFDVDIQLFRKIALVNGYKELPITIDHIVALSALSALPLRHKDPFDRMIIAQAKAESLILLTSDGIMVEYGGDIIKV